MIWSYKKIGGPLEKYDFRQYLLNDLELQVADIAIRLSDVRISDFFFGGGGAKSDGL